MVSCTQPIHRCKASTYVAKRTAIPHLSCLPDMFVLLGRCVDDGWHFTWGMAYREGLRRRSIRELMALSVVDESIVLLC